MTHICISKLTIIGSYNGLSPGRRQAIIWTNVNQCWNIVNWTLRNKHQWNLNWNSNIFTQENAFKSVVCETASILSQPQCVDLRIVGPFQYKDVIYHYRNLNKNTRWSHDHLIYVMGIPIPGILSLCRPIILAHLTDLHSWKKVAVDQTEYYITSFSGSIWPLWWFVPLNQKVMINIIEFFTQNIFFVQKKTLKKWR